MKYKIFALIGEAGSGKDTVMRNILEHEPLMFNEVISCTTRPPREGEAHGVNYYYYTEEEFADKVVMGEMLEVAHFNDWFYGTSYEALRSDVINLGVFNPTGIETMLSMPNIELTVFYIYAKDKTRLLRQLNREEDPDCMEIMRRYRTDLMDFEILEFDHTVLPNETKVDLQDAVNTICLAAKGQK